MHNPTYITLYISPLYVKNIISRLYTFNKSTIKINSVEGGIRINQQTFCICKATHADLLNRISFDKWFLFLSREDGMTSLFCIVKYNKKNKERISKQIYNNKKCMKKYKWGGYF